MSKKMEERLVLTTTIHQQRTISKSIQKMKILKAALKGYVQIATVTKAKKTY